VIRRTFRSSRSNDPAASACPALDGHDPAQCYQPLRTATLHPVAIAVDELQRRLGGPGRCCKLGLNHRLGRCPKDPGGWLVRLPRRQLLVFAVACRRCPFPLAAGRACLPAFGVASCSPRLESERHGALLCSPLLSSESPCLDARLDDGDAGDLDFLSACWRTWCCWRYRPFFWKASLSIELPLTAHGPIHPKVSSRPQPGDTALEAG
jgi:hypothetical protein